MPAPEPVGDEDAPKANLPKGVVLDKDGKPYVHYDQGEEDMKLTVIATAAASARPRPHGELSPNKPNNHHHHRNPNLNLNPKHQHKHKHNPPSQYPKP